MTGFRFHGVSFLAATVERTNGVVTFTITAYMGLRCAFVDIYTRCTVTSRQQSIGACAYVTTRNIAAFTAIANSWILFALVDIHARSTIEIQRKTSAAGARETARRVQADVLAASTSSRAFVYVFAMRLQSSLLITIVAYALIGAHHILADTIRADSTGPRALVDVLAGLFIRS